MIDPASDPALFEDRETFLNRVVEKLGTHDCNFQEAFRGLAPSGKRDGRRRAAGVLLPILFRESTSGGGGEFVFQLIKRSAIVPQPGDLSLPGGMLHPALDRLLCPLLVYGPFPIFTGQAREYVFGRTAASSRLITLFLTNALREAWEEIRLSPARVLFLGPLPTYNLTLFQRTIFPLVGFVEDPGKLRPNSEVEKVVEIPLSSFYRNDVYGCYQVVAPGSAEDRSLQYPCLIHRDSDGREEVLWGATFRIILTFLEIVTSWRLPEWRKGPLIVRNLTPDYLTGRPLS